MKAILEEFFVKKHAEIVLAGYAAEHGRTIGLIADKLQKLFGDGSCWTLQISDRIGSYHYTLHDMAACHLYW